MGVRLWLGSEDGWPGAEPGDTEVPVAGVLLEPGAARRTQDLVGLRTSPGHPKAASGLSFLLGTALVMLRKGCGLAREPTIVFMAVKLSSPQDSRKGDKRLGLSLDLSASPPTGHWAP